MTQLAQCDLSSLESRPKDFCQIRMGEKESESKVYIIVASSTGKVVVSRICTA